MATADKRWTMVGMARGTGSEHEFNATGTTYARKRSRAKKTACLPSMSRKRISRRMDQRTTG